MILRELLVKFGLDFQATDFAKANTAVDSLKNGAVRLAQVIAAGFIARELRDIVTESIEAGASIADMSKQTGVGTAALQELRYAAKLSGLEIAQFDKALGFVSNLAGEAASGNKAAADSFAQYGIKLRDSNGALKTGDVLMSEISDKMKAQKDDVAQLTTATTFFGAKNKNMAILLKNGSGALSELRKEAIDLGYVMSQEMIDKADQLDDNFDRLRMAGQGLRNTIAGELFPWLIKASEAIIAWVKVNRVWLGQKIKERLAQLALAARVVWNILKAVNAAFTALTSIVGGTSNALALLAIAFAVKLVAGIGMAILATEGFTIAQLAARAVAMGNALMMGAIFLALATIIVLVGEEIAAMFTDTDGFFERMQGKWGDLRATLWESMSLDDNPLVLLLKGIGLVATNILSQLDFFFDMVFRGWNIIFDLVENGGVYFEAFAAQVKRSIGEVIDRIKAMFDMIPERLKSSLHLDVLDRASLKVTSPDAMYMRPSPAAAAAGAAGASVSNTVSVSVDAAGQSLNEAALTDMLTRSVESALERQNAQALSALTPESAQ